MDNTLSHIGAELSKVQLAQRLSHNHVRWMPGWVLHQVWTSSITTGADSVTVADDHGRVVEVPLLALEYEMMQRMEVVEGTLKERDTRSEVKE